MYGPVVHWLFADEVCLHLRHSKECFTSTPPLVVTLLKINNQDNEIQVKQVLGLNKPTKLQSLISHLDVNSPIGA